MDELAQEPEFEEVLETHTEAEEKALLDEMEGEDFNPDTVVAKVDPKKAAALAAGQATAMTVLAVSEQVLKQFGHKQFAFDSELAENFANTAAPLFLKYNGELPPWLATYREELTFVVAAGALGFSSFTQIRELKAIDKAKEINPAEAEPQEVDAHAAD